MDLTCSSTSHRCSIGFGSSISGRLSVFVVCGGRLPSESDVPINVWMVGSCHVAPTVDRPTGLLSYSCSLVG